MKVRFRALSLVLLSAIVVLTMSACGGDSSSGPSTTYTVSGTFTLPAGKTLSDVAGKTYGVGVVTDLDSEPIAAYEGVIVSGSGNTVAYTISGVPAGNYYVMGVVYQTAGREDIIDGDYAGVYGWNGVGDPEATMTTVSTSLNPTSIDFTMIECGCGP